VRRGRHCAAGGGRRLRAQRRRGHRQAALLETEDVVKSLLQLLPPKNQRRSKKLKVDIGCERSGGEEEGTEHKTKPIVAARLQERGKQDFRKAGGGNRLRAQWAAKSYAWRLLLALQLLSRIVICTEILDSGHCETLGMIIQCRVLLRLPSAGHRIAEALHMNYVFFCEFEELWSPLREPSAQVSSSKRVHLRRPEGVVSWLVSTL